MKAILIFLLTLSSVFSYECDKTKLQTLQYTTLGELKKEIIRQRVCTNISNDEIDALAKSLLVSGTLSMNVPANAKCSVCGMFVAKYPEWATKLLIGGHELYFDGTKDMMKYYFKSTIKPTQIVVLDYYSLAPVDGSKAFYVVGANVYGPMGKELIPFAKKEEALYFNKDHNGKGVVGFEQITSAMIYDLDR